MTINCPTCGSIRIVVSYAGTVETSRRCLDCAAVTAPDAPDTHTQLETLFAVVWNAEANWNLDDRIDLAARTTRRRPFGSIDGHRLA